MDKEITNSQVSRDAEGECVVPTPGTHGVERPVCKLTEALGL